MYWLGLVKYWLAFTKAENDNQYLTNQYIILLFKMYQ